LNDVHDIAIGHGAAYIKERGQSVGAYLFTPERLAALLVSTARSAAKNAVERKGVAV